MTPFDATVLVLLGLGVIACLVRLAHGPEQRDRFAALLGVGLLFAGILAVFAAATRTDAFTYVALIWLCVLVAGSLRLARLLQEGRPDD
jgi:multisubunit Na+/H+ antiporter MnhF subunit